MITLSDTLLAAQRSSSAVPALRVAIADRDVGVPRLRFTRWYTGAEADGPCAVAVPADGSLVRARIDPSTGALYAQRVAAPGPASTYSAWTALGTVLAGPRAGCHAAGTCVLLATVRTSTTQVEVRESTDSGATFGASSVVATAASAVTAVACAVRTDGSAAVTWAAGGVVYAIRRTGGGSWSSPAAWTCSLASVNGLAMTDASDYAVLVSGVDTGGTAGAWTTRLGSGQSAPPGVWLPLTEVAAAGSGTNVTYLATGAGFAGVARLAFVEVFAGTGAYSRLHLSHAIATTSFDDQMWRGAEPTTLVSAHGASLAGGGASAYLCTPSGVWHATVEAGATEVSADVIEARLDEGVASSRLRLRLRNDDGRYAAGAAPAGLAPGGEIEFEPGCVTSEGVEVAAGRRYWIVAVRRVRERATSVVEIEAEGAWSALAAWRAYRQHSWVAGATSAYAVLRGIARQAGLFLLSAGASAEVSSVMPAYTVRAGERGDDAFARLLDRLPDEARAWSTFLTLTEPLASEDPVYAYGTDHAVRSLHAVAARPGAGWARVFGAGTFAEAVDAAAVTSGAGAVVVVDDNLGAMARVIARAETELRRAARGAESGVLVAPPNAAQQVGDVIEVTDATIGLSAARYRVTSVRLDYAFAGTRVAQATMTLGLGEV